MPLRVELKPFERIVIGETVIINSGGFTAEELAAIRKMLKEYKR